MRLPALALAFLLSLVSVQATAKPSVLATIVPLHSLVANVMGAAGTSMLLIQGAASPHSFALSPSGAKALSAAERVFWIGPELEAFLPRVLGNLPAAVSVALLHRPELESLLVREGGAWRAHDHHDDHGEDDHDAQDDDDERHHAGTLDAHLWLDPHRAMRMVEVIAAELSAADPVNRSTYLNNAAETIARLGTLDLELADALSEVRSVPYVVFHDAYQYFEARYGLNAVGSITLSPDQAPGARRLYDIRAEIAATGARCVFSEPQFEPRLVATVIEGTQAKTATLDPIGASLEPGPDAYFTLMRNTAASLIACLSDNKH